MSRKNPLLKNLKMQSLDIFKYGTFENIVRLRNILSANWKGKKKNFTFFLYYFTNGAG